MIYSKIPTIYCDDRDVTSCAFVRAHEIAFSINFPIFLAAVHACVILVMSVDTLFVRFLNSYVIMLNCCRITVG